MYLSRRAFTSLQRSLVQAAVLCYLLAGGAPAPVLASDDHGDVCAAASVASLNDWAEGHFEAPGDRDLFRLEIETPGILAVEVMDLGRDIGRPEIELLGEDCNLRPGGRFPPHGRGLVHHVTGAGIYYVQVVEQGAKADAPYRLQVGFAAHEDRQRVALWPWASQFDIPVPDGQAGVQGGLSDPVGQGRDVWLMVDILPGFRSQLALSPGQRLGSLSAQTSGDGGDGRFEEETDEWEEVRATPPIPSTEPTDYTSRSVIGNLRFGPRLARASAAGDDGRFEEEVDEWEELTTRHRPAPNGNSSVTGSSRLAPKLGDLEGVGVPFQSDVVAGPKEAIRAIRAIRAIGAIRAIRAIRVKGVGEPGIVWLEPARGRTEVDSQGVMWNALRGQSSLEVRGFDGAGSLAAHLYPVCPRVGLDDHGESFGCSTALPLARPRSGELLHGTWADRDTFSFVLPNPATVILESRGEVDTQARLFDESGFPLLTDDNGGLGLNFRMVVALDSGRYFLRVESVGWSQGSYRIAVSPARVDARQGESYYGQ